MQRRTFLSLAGAWRLQSLDAPKRPVVWTLEHYYLNRAEEIIPLAKELSRDGIVLEAVAAAHMPQLAVLRGAELRRDATIFELRRGNRETCLTPYGSLDERANAWREFEATPTEIALFKRYLHETAVIG